MEYETLAVRLPIATKKKLVNKAKKDGLNASIVLRNLINLWLKGGEKNGVAK
jgi:hypothetical protein